MIAQTHKKNLFGVSRSFLRSKSFWYFSWSSLWHILKNSLRDFPDYFFRCSSRQHGIDFSQQEIIIWFHKAIYWNPFSLFFWNFSKSISRIPSGFFSVILLEIPSQPSQFHLSNLLRIFLGIRPEVPKLFVMHKIYWITLNFSCTIQLIVQSVDAWSSLGRCNFRIVVCG